MNREIPGFYGNGKRQSLAGAVYLVRSVLKR